MPVELPNVNQLFVNPETGEVNRVWYLALLNLNNSVPANVVTSVNLSGLNGITVVGSPITSAGVVTLGIGNLTCANANVAGTVTAANVVVTSVFSAANLTTPGTLTAANAVISGTVTSANIRTGSIVSIGTITANNVVASGTVTAVGVVLTGSFQLGNAFVAGVTTATGTLTVFDSTGTAYKLLCRL